MDLFFRSERRMPAVYKIIWCCPCLLHNAFLLTHFHSLMHVTSFQIKATSFFVRMILSTEQVLHGGGKGVSGSWGGKGGRQQASAVNHQVTEQAGPRPAAGGVGTAGRRNLMQEKSLFQTRLLKLLSSLTVSLFFLPACQSVIRKCHDDWKSV